MEFLGVGAGEALLVLIVALILVGPQRFPEIARQGGRWYRIARRYTTEVMRDVRAAVDEIEQEVTDGSDDLRAVREIGEELQRDVREQREEMDKLGKETRTAAEDASRVEEVVGEPAKPAPRAERPKDTTPTPLRPVERTAETPAEPPAAQPAERAADSTRRSVRPSRRRAAPGAAVDPFEALAAKRARERDAAERDDSGR